MELIKKSESPTQSMTLTRTLIAATGSLGRLIRIHSVISSGSSAADRLLEEVLTDLAREWKLDSDQPPPED